MKIMINNLFYRTGLRQKLIVQPWLTKPTTPSHPIVNGTISSTPGELMIWQDDILLFVCFGSGPATDDKHF